MTRIYHYTSFARAREILGPGGRGLDPARGTPLCRHYPPGASVRGLRALPLPDPPSWRESSIFGSLVAFLMELVEDRLCLVAEVEDGEAIVVDRAPLQAYKCGIHVLVLPGDLPDANRFFTRYTAEEAMWNTRTAPSNRGRWEHFHLPKFVVTSPIPPERVSISQEQPYLLDPRWAAPSTRERCDQFARERQDFRVIWEVLRA